MIDLDELKAIHIESMNEQKMLNMKLDNSKMLDLKRKLKEQSKFILDKLEERLLFAASCSRYLIVGRFPLNEALEQYFGDTSNDSCKRIFRQIISTNNNADYAPLPSLYMQDIRGNLKDVYLRIKSMGLNPIISVSDSPEPIVQMRAAFDDFNTSTINIEKDIFDNNVLNIKAHKEKLSKSHGIKKSNSSADDYALEIIVTWA